MPSSREHLKDKSDREKKSKVHKQMRPEKNSHTTEFVDHIRLKSTTNSHIRALQKRRTDDDTRHSPSKVLKMKDTKSLLPRRKDEPRSRAVRSVTPHFTPHAKVWGGRRHQNDALIAAAMENEQLVKFVKKLDRSVHPMLDSKVFDPRNWLLDPHRICCSPPSMHTAHIPAIETASSPVTETTKAAKALKKSKKPLRRRTEPNIPIPAIETVTVPVAVNTAFINESERIAKLFDKFSQTILPLLDTNVFDPENWFLGPIRVHRTPSSTHAAPDPITETLSVVKALKNSSKPKKCFSELIVDKLQPQHTLTLGSTRSTLSQYVPTLKNQTPPPSRNPQTLSPYFTTPQPYQASPKSEAQQQVKKPAQSKKSPFFPEPFSAHPTPKGLCFDLQPRGYGLIQERIRGSLYALVVQTILWNVTTAEAGRPVLFKLLCAYPTPETLAIAQHEDVLNIVRGLGLQNKRTLNLISMAQKWAASPPDPTRRYYRKDYPFPGSDFGRRRLRTGDLLDPGDDRPGYEIAHFPGIGNYAIDSYRMFYRDTLRGRESGNGFTPEWQKVVPKDKELRKWMIWRWGQEGFDYDVVTGNITRFVDSLRFESSELNTPSVRRTRRLSTISVRSGRTFCGL